MAFHPAVNCVEVTIHGTLGGQEIVNTFYGKFGTAYTQADLDALSAAVDAWVGDAFLTLLNAGYHYVLTRVRGLTSSVDLLSENNTNAGDGAVSGVVMPNNVALAVKRRSAFTGRAARGRVYIPAISQSSLEADNVVSTGFAAAAEAALNLMRDTMSSVDFTEVILHRYASGVPLTTAVIYTLVEYVVVDRVVDSMRRRLPGRGA